MVEYRPKVDVGVDFDEAHAVCFGLGLDFNDEMQKSLFPRISVCRTKLRRISTKGNKGGRVLLHTFHPGKCHLKEKCIRQRHIINLLG